jgi:polysaccharide export outer membrane protein
MTAKFRSKNTVKVGAQWFVAAWAMALGVSLAAQGPVAAPTPPAQSVPPSTPAAPSAATATTSVAATPLASDYVIGTDDVLSIVYWREKDMSGDVTVRADGKISLPLLNDVQAAGLTPEKLRDRLTEDSRRYFEDPNISVVVRQMNSRKVFITGEVAKPGAYLLTASTSVIQLIAMAGGLREYADAANILIVRTENGRQVSIPVNYKGMSTRKSTLVQNIELKPGDTIIVP